MENVHLTTPDFELVKEAAQYLQLNLDRQITIAQLSGQTGIPVKKLKAGFMVAFKQGVNTYHRTIRLEKVKELLLEDKPLKAIAHSTGYNDKNALIKAFRKRYGVPPAVWKRQQANNYNNYFSI